MSAGSTHVEAGEGTAIVRITQHRTRREELSEVKRAVENVAADETKSALQIQWRQNLACDNGALKIGRIGVDGIDDEIRDAIAMLVPRRTVGQLRCHVLTE